MKVSTLTKQLLAQRREQRDLERQGYRKHETDWEIHRGYHSGPTRQWYILDARISVCGLYVYTKIGPKHELSGNVVKDSVWQIGRSNYRGDGGRS